MLNVTPDSFSDGGRYLDAGRAVEHALEMEAAGAAIVDVGGESTRPRGAREVPAEIELMRVAPVLKRLGRRLRIPISIDTRHAIVARAALDYGAAIINDVSALEFDPEMASLAARTRCTVVLMHMRGGPGTHMRFARYHDVVLEVRQYLASRAGFAAAAGIANSRIIIDPGIGFSKSAVHNLKIIAALPSLCALGYPVLVGASRKSFVRKIAGGRARDVEFGTAAVDALAVAAGASIIRVHDPGAEAAVAKMAAAIAGRIPRWHH
ncbi:MAG TPA: dihydropteroate synthase [Candidatus Binataceae bacterium]|nr:dihydropteroate synthase [Candidatus Binataceae bacterium]